MAKTRITSEDPPVLKTWDFYQFAASQQLSPTLTNFHQLSRKREQWHANSLFGTWEVLLASYSCDWVDTSCFSAILRTENTSWTQDSFFCKTQQVEPPEKNLQRSWVIIPFLSLRLAKNNHIWSIQLSFGHVWSVTFSSFSYKDSYPWEMIRR